MTSGAVAPKTNMVALIGFIGAFVLPVAGIVLGVLATRQIGITRESGRGLARWAIVVGSAGALFQLAFFVVWLVLFVSAFSSVPVR